MRTKSWNTEKLSRLIAFLWHFWTTKHLTQKNWFFQKASLHYKQNRSKETSKQEIIQQLWKKWVWKSKKNKKQFFGILELSKSQLKEQNQCLFEIFFVYTTGGLYFGKLIMENRLVVMAKIFNPCWIGIISTFWKIWTTRIQIQCRK